MFSRVAKSTILAILVLVWASEWSQVRTAVLADSQEACLSENFEESQLEKLQLDSLLCSLSSVSLQVDILAHDAPEPLDFSSQTADSLSHQLRGPPAVIC